MEYRQEGGEHSFLYTNGWIHMLLLFGVIVLFLVLVTGGEALLFRAAGASVERVMPLVLFAGMGGGYLLIRGPLRGLYTFCGKGVIFKDHFELRLRFRTYRFEYSRVKRILYKEGRRGRGFILNAKGASLYLEEPRGVGGEPLFAFYRAVEEQWRARQI